MTRREDGNWHVPLGAQNDGRPPAALIVSQAAELWSYRLCLEDLAALLGLDEQTAQSALDEAALWGEVTFGGRGTAATTPQRLVVAALEAGVPLSRICQVVGVDRSFVEAVELEHVRERAAAYRSPGTLMQGYRTAVLRGWRGRPVALGDDPLD